MYARTVLSMVLERFAKGSAATAGAGAGGFAGGFFSSPTFIILGAITVLLLFFQGDIRKAFGDLGKIELPSLPDITFPSFEFPDITFPDITFPSFDIDFPDISNIFGGTGEQVTDFFANLQEQFNLFIGGLDGGGGLPLPPDVEDIGLIEDPATACPCGSNIVQDIQGDVSQVCIPCPEIPEEGDPGFIGPVQPEPPFMLPPTEPEPPFDEPEPPFEPPIELPPGFEGGGVSFEGGTIFERDPCFMTLNEIINAGLADSASAAANLKAIACSANVTDEPTDFPPEFEFGTNIGESTPEIEAQKAACTTCQLFGLNCPECAGTI